MHWGDMPGWGWGGWLLSTLMMLLFVGAVIAVLVALLRRPDDRATGPGAGPGPNQAEQILAERFARGDIDEDEFRRRRQALHTAGRG